MNVDRIIAAIAKLPVEQRELRYFEEIDRPLSKASGYVSRANGEIHTVVLMTRRAGALYGREQAQIAARLLDAMSNDVGVSATGKLAALRGIEALRIGGERPAVIPSLDVVLSERSMRSPAARHSSEQAMYSLNAMRATFRTEAANSASRVAQPQSLARELHANRVEAALLAAEEEARMLRTSPLATTRTAAGELAQESDSAVAHWTDPGTDDIAGKPVRIALQRRFGLGG